MASIDFFTVPTATFRVLFVFLVVSHDRRRLVHFAITEHPSQEWTAQQIRNAGRLGLPTTIDFRSFRTMHASLMRRFGARLEVARDNMGHVGNTGSITLDVYSKTWWEERVEAVTRIVEAVLTEPEEERKRTIDTPLLAGGTVAEWEPFWEPQLSTKTASC